MQTSLWSYPGRALEHGYEAATISWNLLRMIKDLTLHANRLRIVPFVQCRYPEIYAHLDGGDRRIVSAWLEPDWLSNIISLLGGKGWNSPASEYRYLLNGGLQPWLTDSFGRQAGDDVSFIERSPGADQGNERWVFINGIINSPELARMSVQILEKALGKKLILVHNPTHGIVNDVIESALQKLRNINTEPVARAFVEIGRALCQPDIEKVVVIAHSQGAIITGDVLDIIYASFGDEYLDRTNMLPEEVEQFRATSFGTLPRTEVEEVMQALKIAQPEVIRKLELYMFANAASRMCYLLPEKQAPHIESFANHHDAVSHLGVLAIDELHARDLLHIDGSLFACNRYGHLLNAHYLHGFRQIKYRLLKGVQGRCVGTSVHDQVLGNPCAKNPGYLPGPPQSRLFGYLAGRLA